MRRLAFGPLFLLPCMFAVQGCHVSQYTATFTETCALPGSSSSGCTETAGGTATFVPKVIAQTVYPSDLVSTNDGSYTISISAPSNTYSLNSGATPETTLTATTDTGYSSSITLLLTPVSAVISPVNHGDAVFSFNLPNTPAVNTWVQTVSANTNTSLTLTTSASLPLTMVAGSGTVTASAVLTSNYTGTFNAGSTVIVRNAPPSKGGNCGSGGICPVLPGN